MISHREAKPSSQSSTMKKMVIDGDSPFLPQDIIPNILKRLPVKSLIRFQCVCKDWKNLFKTPFFVEEHLHHSSLQNPSLLFQIPRICSLHFLNWKMQVREVHNIPFYFMRPRIIGSSHGLICVVTHHSIALWNPAIREVRPVPMGAIKEIGGHYHFGFGFSSIINDFKLVRFFVSYHLVKQVEVYSLNRGSWKKIDFDFEAKASYFETVTANGVMFWLPIKIGLVEDVDFILSFDITKEVFTRMPLPTLDFYSSPQLTVYDNKLAVLSRTRTRDIDLWVMEEGTSASGERWSWTKKHTIVTSPGMLRPFGISKNNVFFYVDEVRMQRISN